MLTTGSYQAVDLTLAALAFEYLVMQHFILHQPSFGGTRPSQRACYVKIPEWLTIILTKSFHWIPYLYGTINKLLLIF